MNDQGWDINAGQIIAKIGEPGRYTTKVAFAEDPTAHSNLPGIASLLTLPSIHIEERFEKSEK